MQLSWERTTYRVWAGKLKGNWTALKKQAVRADLDLSCSEKVTAGTSCEYSNEYVDSIISEEFLVWMWHNYLPTKNSASYSYYSLMTHLEKCSVSNRG